jgi:hypothetical protein
MTLSFKWATDCWKGSGAMSSRAVQSLPDGNGASGVHCSSSGAASYLKCAFEKRVGLLHMQVPSRHQGLF